MAQQNLLAACVGEHWPLRYLFLWAAGRHQSFGEDTVRALCPGAEDERQADADVQEKRRLRRFVALLEE